MYIERLRLKNFRNYENFEIDFAPGINFIIGNNGVGKTNIIEAVSILSGLKSFRNIGDSEIIKWGTDSYYCSVSVEDCENDFFEVGCAYIKGSIKKKVKIDSEVIKKSSEYYGILLTVIFSPDDINIIYGSPETRRKFFDSVFSKIDPSYFISLCRYKHVLKSRNIVLKKMRVSGSFTSRELDIWDNMISELAVDILSKRKEYIGKFSDLFRSNYNTVSGIDSDIEIQHRTDIIDFSVPAFNSNLIKNRKRDIISGSTGIGPHRDDYIIRNSLGKKYSLFASQGQIRLASISLRIAENIIIEITRQKKTIILVDDIFSELDNQRRQGLVDYFGTKNQVIFSMTDDKLTYSGNYEIKKFHINNCKIVK